MLLQFHRLVRADLTVDGVTEAGGDPIHGHPSGQEIAVDVDESKAVFVELKPGLYEAELNLGIVLVRNKQFAEAVAPLDAASGQKPKEFRPHYYWGEALLGTGQFAQAATVLEGAAGLDPKSAAVELAWGRALVGDQKLDDAAAHFRKAAELDAKYRDLPQAVGKHGEPFGKVDSKPNLVRHRRPMAFTDRFEPLVFVNLKATRSFAEETLPFLCVSRHDVVDV